MRTVIFSCKLFFGYKCTIDLDECESCDDIINLSVIKLKDIFVTNHLELLVEELDGMKFHIHDVSFEDILLADDPEEVIYVCDHCTI